MSKWQKYLLGVGAFGAWLALMGVSIVANYRFGSSLGTTEIDQSMLGIGSVASDLFKAAAPVGFLMLMAAKRYTAASGLAVLGIVTTIYSLIAATGFAAGNRYHAFYEAERQVKETKDLEANIKRVERRLDWSPADKPKTVLQADLKVLEVDAGYKASVYCTQPEKAQKLCREYRTIEAKIAAAEQYEKDITANAEGRDKLRKDGRYHSDPSVEALHKATGVRKERVLIGFIALTVLLIELGSALGLTVSLALLAPEGSTMKQAIRWKTLLDPFKRKDKIAEQAVIDAPLPKIPTVPRPEVVAKAARAASFNQPATEQSSDRGGYRIRPYDPAIDGPLGVKRKALKSA